MSRVWTRIALLRALADLRRERTSGTVALYAAIALCGLVVVSVPVCGTTQDQLARAHHARPSSVVSWSAFQLVPKMYSFGHRVWYSREPVTDYLLSRPEGPGFELQTLWVNHYPIRTARFESGRKDVVDRGEDVHLLVRSGYQGRRWESRFVVHVEGHDLILEDETR